MALPTIKIPKVIGHRGACGYAPENTFSSMRKAYELGVKWVEFDVMLTQDQEAIIIHDDTLDRTSSGTGKVADTTLLAIKKLTAGQWFNEKFSDELIPTFSELLALLKELNLHINVEIKPTAGKEIATAKKVMEILQRDWPIKISLPFISSAQEAALQTVYAIDPNLPLAFITDVWLENWQQKLQDLHCLSLNIFHQALDAKKVAAVKQAGKYVLAYTVNDAARAKELFSWGVDGVFSDFPDKILAINC